MVAGNSFAIPGASAATLVMVSVLHARRLYNDRKIEEARVKGIEFPFQPDVKATILEMLPLRLVSRLWGSLASLELPVWLRPHVYQAWARAFHSNLEEMDMPFEDYASLREFFARRLKEGSRPINNDPKCLVSPVDGIVLRFGSLKESFGMIEQVKGFTYPVSPLLGVSPFLRMQAENNEADKTGNTETNLEKKLYYCVIYLKLGDYHRIHSPMDWNVLCRRHFSGRLFPLNERATRTLRNLYVENERVVLEGLCHGGYLAMVAVGATNIGSIELSIEPEFRSNLPRKMLFCSEPPCERIFEPAGTGRFVKKGDEIGAFNMGSTVVLVFECPKDLHDGTCSSSEFEFNITRGSRVRVGEALGKWHT